MNAGIVDIRGAAESRSDVLVEINRRAEHAPQLSEIDIERIEETPVGRIIRTDARAILRKQGVQRIDRDERSAGLGADAREFRERREVADALIAVAAHGIELRGEAEFASRVVRQKAARRRDGERTVVAALDR